MKGITKLGPGGEFERIRQIIDALGEGAALIGDDAAVIDVPRGQRLVISTDTSVDNVHFRRAWLSFEEIGYRSTAAALSDLAAMGATPIGILVAIALPDNEATVLEDIARGAGRAARDSGTVVIGGDLSTSSTLTITVTVLGSSAAPLTRSGASPGDRIFVTGTLGGAELCLAAFKRGAAPGEGARRKFAMPRPRIQEALWLRDRGAAACIDISDGIVGDLGHLAAASAVNLLIDMDALPLFDGASTAVALRSGEEYELCVSSPLDIDTAEFEEQFGIPLTLIGRAEMSTAPVVMFQAGGAPVEAPPSFSHFSK